MMLPLLKGARAAVRAPFAAALNHHVAALATSAAGGGENSAVKALREGSPPPAVLGFELSRRQALQRFERYQRQQCLRMHAHDPLRDATMSAELLPFWVFEATASVECRATLGRRADKSDPKSPMVWTPMEEWLQVVHQQACTRDQAHMQVYASYQLRRDLAEGAKPALQMLAAARALTLQEAVALSVDDQWGVASPPTRAAAAAAAASTSATSAPDGAAAGSAAGGGDAGLAGGPSVPLQAPEMRQAIAWQLCYRQLKRRWIAVTLVRLRESAGAEDVRDLQVRMQVHTRSARLVFVPAFHLSYTYGEKYTPGRGQIVPERFEALVCGVAPPLGGAAAGDVSVGVVSELHPSPAKAQAAAAGAVAGLGLAAVPGLGMLAGVDPSGVAWGLVDAGFAAFVAGAAAGMVVQRMPQVARNRHVAEQVRAEKEFYRQYDRRETSDSHAAPDEHTLWLWMDADWRKWEEEDPWDWDPARRRQWAGDLYRQQMQRRLTWRRHTQRLERQRLREEEEDERERKRQAKFGAAQARSEHFMGGAGAAWDGAGSTGGDGAAAVRAAQRKRRRDFLGYYRLLGIQLEGEEPVTVEAIKASFKKAALQMHPDCHAGSDDAALKKASEQFRRLQTAYEVLRDPDKRRAYDRGQLMR